MEKCKYLINGEAFVDTEIGDKKLVLCGADISDCANREKTTCNVFDRVNKYNDGRCNKCETGGYAKEGDIQEFLKFS